MKVETIFVFLFGYFLFTILMQAFGIGDMINEKLRERNHYNEKFNYGNDQFIKKSTELKPDEKSTALTISKEELGKMTWVLLHSVAATYPIDPDKKEKQDLENFIHSL